MTDQAQTSDQTNFTFPPIHTFPPFFTRQPTQSTWDNQVQQWSALILAYCKHHHIFRLSVSSDLHNPLFHNKYIDRHLSSDTLTAILDHMAQQGTVDRTGQVGSILTLRELERGSLTEGQEFHGMDGDLLAKVLHILVTRKKAHLFKSSEGSETGIKFL
ncbi:MAG: hypothetical protein DHS80DRAFT_31476 [Piptocephalis tieghemiana]|nr:MAG: hypothetical protein DHS80DRAFT_31476 [Piptocephalis tieghemiana]